MVTPARLGFAIVLVLSLACQKSANVVTGTATQIGDNMAHSVGAPLQARLTSSGTWEQHPVVDVATDRFEMKMVLERSPGCQGIMAETVERVNYRNAGNFGRLTSPNDSCDLIGTLNLEAWFGQRSAPRSRAPNPRATATYRVVGSDDSWTYLRGRFPLVGIVGIPGGIDVVVAVPHSPICDLLLERTLVQMEFRRRGTPLVFMARGREECPCEGVIRPQTRG